MELPHLGNHCSNKSCNKLDFLPIKCDACGQIFCNDHYNYTNHDCSESYKKNNQVPVCPLCNIPIPVQGQQPDIAVSAHIDADCQSNPAKNRRKVFTNRCSLKGCKVKEVIPVLCNDCGLNYCLKHRHPLDHNCEKDKTKKHNRLQKLQQPSLMALTNSVQGTMSEDEALAKALALSMQENGNKPLSQEELDLALARQLQATEASGQSSTGRNERDRCSVS